MHVFNQVIEVNGAVKIAPYLRPYIIAEMACAHDGDFDKARAIIDAAADAKADAVQLQFFRSDHVVTPRHPVHGLLKEIEFSDEQWKQLYDHARAREIDVWACVYDAPSVDLARQLGVDGIKLNSADLSNPDVVKGTANLGVPFTLGTGASTMEEIAAALREVAEEGAKNVVLMYGVQNFPTVIANLHINKLNLLRDVFGLPVGYADHTDAELEFAGQTDLLAMGVGAGILEKHICMDRATTKTDFQAALQPEEFSAYVQRMHTGAAALGDKSVKPFDESDLRYRTFQKKSIVAARELKAGAVLKRDDVLFIRNDVNGLSPRAFAELEGKTLVRSIKQFDNLATSDVQD